jgi:hypothetical protein
MQQRSSSDEPTCRNPKRTQQIGSLIRSNLSRLMRCAISFAAVASITSGARADEGGVSFWVPGFFGSLAAAPQQPGWSLATIYYHTSISAGADVGLSRDITIGRVPANLTANSSLMVSGTGDLGFVIPTYVFATPVLGAQASASLAGAYGVVNSNLGGSLSGTLATPGIAPGNVEIGGAALLALSQ